MQVFTKVDQPTKALHVLDAAITHATSRPCMALLLHAARIHEALGATDTMATLLHQVLQQDACNMEAIALLAAHHYHTQQPEVAAVLYARLVQLGHTAPEVWCNLGLSSAAADRLETCCWAFERALAASGDDGVKADVWYNIGHMAVRTCGMCCWCNYRHTNAGLGDLSWALQCFRLASALQPLHAEALTCAGVLQHVKHHDVALAASDIAAAQRCGSRLGVVPVEALYNGALLAWEGRRVEAAHRQALAALAVDPGHVGTQRLMAAIQEQVATLL